MEYNKAMVSTMKKNKAKSVFINENGEWLFHETKGFEEHTREQVLGDEEEVKEPKVKEPKAKK
ncbi:MAG: hypothetical protein V4538_16280 [Bacteroidota bacterium]